MRQQAGGELTPSQTAALASIANRGPLTPSELAELERIQRPTATRVIALLEDAGLVSRQPDPLDRRSALLSATPEGNKLLRQLRTRKTAYLAQLLADLDPHELETLDAAAEIMARLLEGEPS